jgi:hypothetical protein
LLKFLFNNGFLIKENAAFPLMTMDKGITGIYLQIRVGRD